MKDIEIELLERLNKPMLLWVRSLNFDSIMDYQHHFQKPVTLTYDLLEKFKGRIDHER